MTETDPIVPGEAGATAESQEEKRRRLWRERKRKQRSEQRDEKAAQTMEAESDWYASNRAQLQPNELEVMQAQDARCHDFTHVMRYATKNNISVDDLNFIFEKDFVAELVEFVKDFGVAHLGAITRGDIPNNWPERKYWQDSELLAALEDEGPQTQQYIRFGLLAGLPDWRVYFFLMEIAKWRFDDAADLLGYKTDHNNTVRYQ